METSLIALVFDDAAEFHSGIARKYHLYPFGSGMFEIDFGNQTIRSHGASKAYGLEPRREHTKKALAATFLEWKIAVE